jgi:hypothetical protein
MVPLLSEEQAELVGGRARLARSGKRPPGLGFGGGPPLAVAVEVV